MALVSGLDVLWRAEDPPHRARVMPAGMSWRGAGHSTKGRFPVLKSVYKSSYGAAVYGEFWRQRYFVSPYTPIPTIYTKEIGVKKVLHFFVYFSGFAVFFGPAISHLTLRQQ